MKNCADYIADGKAALGNPKMSDRELGERVGRGWANSTVNMAKKGRMTDPFAIELAQVIGIEPGEVLMVARLEREKDPVVKAALMSWAGKVFGLLPNEQGAAVPVLAAGPNVPELALIDVAMPRATKRSAPLISQRGASIGGEGGIRTHGTLFTYA